VIPSRTFVIGSSQQVAGHLSGEAGGTGAARFTRGVAGVTLTPTRLTLQRDDDTAAAAFTVYVVELTP
jgi:hypothetical protein